MKKLEGADGTGKILKVSTDTGKTLHRRKVLTKAARSKSQSTLESLILRISRCYPIATSALANGAEGPGHSKRFSSSTPTIFPSVAPKLYNIVSALA